MSTTPVHVKTPDIETLMKAGSMAKMLEVLKPSTPAAGERKVVIPKKIEMSDRVRQAVERFPETIKNAVCPTERRALTAEEVVALLDEREDLDLIEKLIKERKDAQRTAVFNHHDVVLESTGKAEGLDVSEDGWYISKAGVGSAKHEKGFTRTIVPGSPVLTSDALKAVEGMKLGDNSEFSHDDYLACTTAVRVVDEAKVMLHLRARPAIAEAIREATIAGKPTIQHRLGKVES